MLVALLAVQVQSLTCVDRAGHPTSQSNTEKEGTGVCHRGEGVSGSEKGLALRTDTRFYEVFVLSLLFHDGLVRRLLYLSHHLLYSPARIPISPLPLRLPLVIVMQQSSSHRRIKRIDEEQRIAKANESSVRFLQLSLQLFFQWGYDSFKFLLPLGQFITYTKEGQSSHFMGLRVHLEEEAAEPDYYTRIVQPLCMYWTFYNMIVMVGLKCVDELSKGSLIFTGVINYLVALFIIILGFIEDSTSGNNASVEIYHRYAPFQVLNCLTVVSLFYFTRAQEPRRFSTSPGNFVWVWLFLAWSWEKDIQGYMLAIGIIFCIITTTSVAMLLLELMKGLTTTVKKILILQLVFSLVLTGLTEIFAVISHNAIAKIAEQEKDEMIEDDIAVGLLQIFIIVNIVDMWFWIFGRCVTN